MAGGRMELSERQNRIVEIVKECAPIKSSEIAEKIGVNRATIRPDLKILTMTGILEAKRKVGYTYTGHNLMHFFGNYIRTIPVTDIQSPPTTVDEATTIYDGVITMFTRDAGTLYVVDGPYLSGVVSRKDFMKSMISHTKIDSLPIPVIMTRIPNIIYLEESESVYDAAVKTMEYDVESLPIIRPELDEQKQRRLRLIGKVSRTNITRYVVNLGRDQEGV